MVMTETIKGVLWLKSLFDKLRLYQGITTIYCDSQSAIHLTKNQMYQERTKHIDVKFYLIRDFIVEGKVLVSKVNMKENPADMFTKPLSVYKFKQCLNLINIRC